MISSSLKLRFRLTNIVTCHLNVIKCYTDEDIARSLRAKDADFPGLKKQRAQTKIVVLEKGFCYGKILI